MSMHTHMYILHRSERSHRTRHEVSLSSRATALRSAPELSRDCKKIHPEKHETNQEHH